MIKFIRKLLSFFKKKRIFGTIDLNEDTVCDFKKLEPSDFNFPDHIHYIPVIDRQGYDFKVRIKEYLNYGENIRTIYLEEKFKKRLDAEKAAKLKIKQFNNE